MWHLWQWYNPLPTPFAPSMSRELAQQAADPSQEPRSPSQPSGYLSCVEMLCGHLHISCESVISDVNLWHAETVMNSMLNPRPLLHPLMEGDITWCMTEHLGAVQVPILLLALRLRKVFLCLPPSYLGRCSHHVASLCNVCHLKPLPHLPPNVWVSSLPLCHPTPGNCPLSGSFPPLGCSSSTSP